MAIKENPRESLHNEAGKPAELTETLAQGQSMPVVDAGEGIRFRHRHAVDAGQSPTPRINARSSRWDSSSGQPVAFLLVISGIEKLLAGMADRGSSMFDRHSL